jgi:hypothetical protein
MPRKREYASTAARQAACRAPQSGNRYACRQVWMQSNRNVRTKTIPQGHKKLEKSQ